MKKILKTAALLVTTTILFSCQKSATENLKDAQLCLNTSAPAGARGCLSKIEGDTSTLAYKLRCSAVFISEGYNTPASFITALDSLKTPTGTCGTGCSSTVNAVTALSFKSGNNVGPSQAAIDSRKRNNDVAAEAYNYCQLSETPIYFQISSLFKIGTLASMFAYGSNGLTGTPTTDQIKTALGQLQPADLGAIVIATYAASCKNIENASESTKTYCAELAAAQNSGNGSATAVGTCFQIKLSNPTAPCP